MCYCSRWWRYVWSTERGRGKVCVTCWTWRRLQSELGLINDVVRIRLVFPSLFILYTHTVRWARSAQGFISIGAVSLFYYCMCWSLIESLPKFIWVYLYSFNPNNSQSPYIELSSLDWHLMYLNVTFYLRLSVSSYQPRRCDHRISSVEVHS